MRLITAASCLTLATGTAATACTAEVRHIFGIEVQSIEAVELRDFEWYSLKDPPATLPLLPAQPKPLNVCNITIYHTQPGLGTVVRTSVWLPLEESDWNGRFLGQGGSGYAAGVEGALAPAVALGYAAANHDGGHSNFGDIFTSALNSSWWGLKSPGNVDMNQLHNLGHRTLEEFTLIAKQVTENYYGKKIKNSYWNGCSTGGRQGMILAQRYPSLYQGILSVAPAFNWVTFLVTEFWPHVVMKELGYYPPPCELNAITQLAIEACDELDGLKDGIISGAGHCNFDPTTVIGKTYDCEGKQRKITKEAAQVAAETWSGPIKEDGTPVWFGLTHDSSLPGMDLLFGGLATTTCSSSNKKCKSRPFPISADWIRTWLLKDPDASLEDIDRKEFYRLLRLSRQQYYSAIDSADLDLSTFAEAGGKMISWHGLADQLIPPNGTTNYYQRVSSLFPDTVDSFYRHFDVPGVAHCIGGSGPYPIAALRSLVDWVENGKKPDRLPAMSIPMPGQDMESFVQMRRPICPWPMVARFVGGSGNEEEDFECAHGFGNVGKGTSGKGKDKDGKDEL